MARLIPQTWNNTLAYSVGTKALYLGSIYRCAFLVPANASGNPIPVDNDDWKLDSVQRIEEVYSLQNAIELSLNTNDSKILGSIPQYIQFAEQSMSKLLRSPAQTVTRIVVVDSEGRFPIPTDLISIMTLRRNVDNYGYTLRDRGAISIKAAVNKTTYDRVRLEQNNSEYAYAASETDFPVYYNDSTHIWIAPLYEAGSEIEITYVQGVPELGSIVYRVNSLNLPLNSADQTATEWVAAGNELADFVQAQDTVLSNLWTATAPQVMKLGALVAAESDLNDVGRSTAWKGQYDQAMLETQKLFNDFVTDRQVQQGADFNYY